MPQGQISKRDKWLCIIEFDKYATWNCKFTNSVFFVSVNNFVLFQNSLEALQEASSCDDHDDADDQNRFRPDMEIISVRFWRSITFQLNYTQWLFKEKLLVLLASKFQEGHILRRKWFLLLPFNDDRTFHFWLPQKFIKYRRVMTIEK